MLSCHEELPATYGAVVEQARAFTANTNVGREACSAARSSYRDSLQFVEVHLPRTNAPVTPK